MIRPHLQHVAIIGGGFSGTLTAVNLARLSTAPLRISILNCAYPSGRGIAYSTRRPEHLLNVAARNMSALSEYPNHFVDWLLTRTEYANIPEAELRETFMPRRIYGDYLRNLAWHYSGPQNSRSRVEIKNIEGEVIDLIPDALSARLLLADGTTLLADRVVLATGNEPPADLSGATALAEHPAWCANPWIDWEKKLPAPGGTIVLLGTGLTTVDAILTLLALDWSGHIHAVSRHGLLPQSHFKGVDVPDFPPAEVDLVSLRLTELAGLMEHHCERLRRSGANPAIIVDKLRPHTQRIWQGFTDQERQEFITHYSSRWNVIRHRIAPSIHHNITAAVTAGRVAITTASITNLQADGPKIVVDLKSSNGTSSSLRADLVINGTGPQTRFSATRSPLLRALLKRGLAQADASDMGLKIAADFTVIQKDDQPSPHLLALGPLLRGTLWETIAVPELRGQALRVAQSLLAAPPNSPADEAAVIEYCI
ncbi:MAG: FAD/NAD(P)-binding protein [Opitutaceae bacterium]